MTPCVLYLCSSLAATLYPLALEYFFLLRQAKYPDNPSEADTGNFKVSDPYADIVAAIPYAANWQVKESVFRLDGKVITDFSCFMKILKNSDYLGYIPVEILSVKYQLYGPFALFSVFMKNLKIAKDAEFK